MADRYLLTSVTAEAVGDAWGEWLLSDAAHAADVVDALGAVATSRTLAGLSLASDRSAADLVGALQSAARVLPESLPGASWTPSAGVGTATAATLTLTLPGSTVATSHADVPRLTIPHNRDAWQIEVTARLAAFTGGAASTFAGLKIADSSGNAWLLVQCRGSDGELSIFQPGTFLGNAAAAFALGGNDRVRVVIRDGVVSVYTGDASHWVRQYHNNVGSGFPGSSGDYSLVSLVLNDGTGAAGTVTVQWADVVVRSL